MKQKLTVFAAVTTLAVCASVSRADVYPDATADLHNGVPTGANFTGFTHLDITSVEVTNTASDMIFKIQLAGNPVATDWGKYCIGIQVTNAVAFDTSANGNGWTRPISIPAGVGPVGGMSHWVGSWVDGTMGAQLWNYTGAWNGPGGAAISKTTTNVTITFPYAGLGAVFGDTIYFDVYATSGGGTDSAVDALSQSTLAITDWAGPYVNTALKSYTLQVVTAIPHTVKFAVDMGVPIWEYDNAVGNGFYTNADAVYVRGNFNGWGTTSADQLFRDGGSTVYTNSITFLATPNDTIQYKFEGFSFPGYENPLFTGGGNRTLTLTNTSIVLPTACFGDRCLSDPPVSTVNFRVDMSVAKRFGVFDPATNGVTLPGNFNGWSTTALPLSPDAAPNDNVYTNSLTYYYYPLGLQNVGFYKFYITNLANEYRDNGWEQPIGNGGGNRSFGIASANQTLSYTYNDENPVINASIQPVNGTDVAVSFNSFPSRGGFPGYPTGGVYAVESATSLSGPWTTNAVIYSTSATSHYTNTGVLPGTPQQYYRVGLIGLEAK